MTEGKEAALDPRQPLLSQGDLVDHFEVKRFLGRGGMGEVYLARDTKLGRRVALKFVHPEALGTEGDSGALDRFMFEARATARFSHPHIVTVFGVGEHAGRPYLALEYLEGKTLRRLIQERGRLPVSEAIAIAQAVAEALVEAHGHDLLHRDLKPENVIIPPDGRLRVLDFGLAKPVAAPEREAERAAEGRTDQASSQAFEPLGQNRFETADGKIVGTPMYMAPEQWLAMPSTAATDVWALGVMLFELLAGRPPFAAATACALCAAVCSDDPAPPIEGPEPIPTELTGLVSRCLDKLPGGRPQAREVVETLRRLRASAPGGDAAVERDAGLAETQLSPGARVRRRTVASVVLGGALLALAALAIYAAVSAGPNESRQTMDLGGAQPASARERQADAGGEGEGPADADPGRAAGVLTPVAPESGRGREAGAVAGSIPTGAASVGERTRTKHPSRRRGPDAGAATPLASPEPAAPARDGTPAAEPSFVEQFDPR